MAEDWLADVLKYDANANPDIVAGIVRYCGIALRKRDSSLVSFTSPDELGRVRDNFLRKKLGRPEGDSVLNDAIAAVGQVMKADRTKNRVTVYYLLAREFDQLHLFERSSASKRARLSMLRRAFSVTSPTARARPALRRHWLILSGWWATKIVSRASSSTACTARSPWTGRTTASTCRHWAR